MLLDGDHPAGVLAGGVAVGVLLGDADDAAVVVLLRRPVVEAGEDHHVAGLGLEGAAEVGDHVLGEQPHVAGEDVDLPVPACGGRVEVVEGDAHGVAGAGGQAEDGVLLVGEAPSRADTEVGGHLPGLDAHHEDLVGALQAVGHGVGDARHRGPAPDLVEHLGGVGADALAVAGGQDHADAARLLQQGRVQLAQAGPQAAAVRGHQAALPAAPFQPARGGSSTPESSPRAMAIRASCMHRAGSPLGGSRRT